MKAPRKILELLKLGHQVDRLFKTIDDAATRLHQERFTLGTKKYAKQSRELEALINRLLNECTLSDDTKALIFALENVEFDAAQTKGALDEVRAKWTAFKAKTKGKR